MNSEFKIIAGSAMSGKTYKLCMDILKEANEHPRENFLIIIPEQVGNAYEKKLIELNKELTGHPGFMNIDVIGFGRLSHRIFDEMGVKDSAVLEEYEKSMLIRVVSGQVVNELKVYGGSIDKVGFTKKMKSLLSELIQYGITTEDIENVIKGLSDSGSDALAAKLSDVNAIYKGFLGILEGMDTGLSEERMKLLGRILSGDKPCSVIDNAVICFDEFRGFTPDQLKVIGALKNRAKELRFGLCIENEIIRKNIQIKEHDIFRQSFETYRSLQEVMGEKPQLVYMERNRKGMLGHLEKSVFRFPVSESAEDDGNVVFFSARDPEEEIRLVAEDIRKEVRSGLRYKDIVVVTGDTENFDRYGDKIFREYNIPVFCDYNRKLRKNPYTEAIIRIFDIAIKDFDYSSVFGLVKTGVLDIDDIHGIDNLENFVLKTGIRGKKLWEKTIEPYGDKVSEEEKKKFNNMDCIRGIIVDTVKPMTSLVAGTHCVSEILDALKMIIDDLEFESRMEESAKRMEDMGLMADSRVMRSLFGIISHLIEETNEFLGQQEMKLSEFAEVFQSGIEEVTIGVIPPTIDSVQICDMTRSRIIDPKVVHFINVNDGIVPSASSAGSILSDKDKDKVVGILENLGTGKKLAVSGVRQSIDELFMIYQILSKPSKKLTISYILTDMEGNEAEPSFLVGRIKRLFPAAQINFREPAPFEGTERSDRNYYIQWLRDMLEEIHTAKEEELTPAFNERMKNVVKYLKFGEHSDISEKEELMPALMYSNKAENVPDDVMRGLNLKLSVSKLESYASCPYSYFLKYILGLRERPERKIENYDVGNIIHHSLELVMNEVKEKQNNNWRDIEDNSLIDIMHNSLEKAWSEYDMTGGEELREEGKTEYIYQNLIQLADRTVLTLKSHINSGEMLPDRMEQEFTAEFVANRPDGTEVPITIQGKIDRIDTFEEDDKLYVRVIDYKTGNHDFKPVNIKEGTDIQLSVYTSIITKIIRAEIRDKKIIPAGMYFYHVANPVISPPDKKTLDKCDGDNLKASVIQLEKNLKLRGVSNLDPLGASEGDELYNHRYLNLHDRMLVSHETGSLLTSSLVVPVSEKDGQIKDSSVVATTDDIEGVCDFSIEKMKSTADMVLSGSFEKRPAKQAGAFTNSCEYCDYGAVCRFNKTSGSEKIIRKPEGSIAQQIKELSKETSDEVQIKNARFRR